MRAKKVFIVKNFKSPYVEEAIFFLKENAPPGVTLSDAVSEAERIVAGYLAGLDCPPPPRKKTGGKVLAVCLFLLSLFALWRLFFTA